MTARFHPLRVTEVTPLTDDSVAVTCDVPEDLREVFRYLPGQHVTVRAFVDGKDVRRSYSICANANSGKLRVGIKRLQGGAFSNWAVDHLRAGDALDVMPPVGEFTIEPDPAATRRYVAICAGSGITPVLSLVSTTLEAEPGARWSVVYGNRSARTVMFLDELEGLKDRYPDRVQLVHVLSREDTGLPLLKGRIDAGKLRTMLSTILPPDDVDGWFLCGPYELVRIARGVIEEAGADPASIRDELFFAGPPDPSMLPPEPEEGQGSVLLTFSLEGRASTVRMRPETRVLDAALSVRPELPFSCKGGMCASCKARLVEGEVRMEKNWALVEEDLEAGFVLTCQSHPLTDRLTVDFDQR